MSVTIAVPVPDELYPLLRQKAQSAGMETDEYLGALVSRELRGPAGLDELLAGFRAEVESSGLSDDGLTELFESARNEVAARRRD